MKKHQQLKVTLIQNPVEETLAENDATPNSTILPSPFSAESAVTSSPHIPAAQAGAPRLPTDHHAGTHVRDELCRDDLFNHLLKQSRQREAELARLEGNHAFGFKPKIFRKSF